MGKLGFVPLGKGPEPLYKVMSRDRIMQKLEEKYPLLVPGKRWMKRSTGKVNQLILTPEASKELMDYFKWGVTHPNNVFEQQAALVGYLFKDPATGRFTAVAECLIPAMAKNRSPVGAQLTADDTADVQCEVNVINRNLRRVPGYGVFTHMGEMMIVAWVHSHPNELDVFLSSTDMATHLTHYGGSEDGMGVSMVVNPHRSLARAFGGAKAKEVEVVWICQPVDYARLMGESMAEPVFMEVVPTGRALGFAREAEAEAVRIAEVQPAAPRETGHIHIEGPGDVVKRNPTGIIGKEETSAKEISGEKGCAAEEERDEKKVTSLEHVSHKTITTPTGGAWPQKNGVSDGSQSRGEIKYGDIAGKACYYPSSEEYYLKQGSVTCGPRRLGWRPFAGLRDLFF